VCVERVFLGQGPKPIRAARQPEREEKQGGRAEEGAGARLHRGDGHRQPPAAELEGGEEKNGDSSREREPGWRAVPSPSPFGGRWQRLPAFSTLMAHPKRACWEMSRQKESRGRPARTSVHPGMTAQSSPQQGCPTPVPPRRGPEPTPEMLSQEKGPEDG